MEAHEILTKVRRYPGYDECVVKDERSFIIMNVMWHLAKSVRVCTEARKRAEVGYSYEQFCETLATLMRGAILAALTGGVGSVSLESVLDEWKSEREPSADPFKKGRDSLYFPDLCDRLIEEIFLVLELTASSEPRYQDLEKSLLRLVQHTLRLATMFSYGREEFERFLTSPAQGLAA